MLSLMWMTLISAILSAPAEAEPLPSDAELRANYAHAVEEVLPLRVNCSLVSEPHGVESQTKKDQENIESLRLVLASVTGRTATEREVKAELRKEIATLKFAVKHPPRKSEHSFGFATDGDSFQLSWPTVVGNKMPNAIAVPSADNLVAVYAQIAVFSFNSAADKPNCRLWSGVLNGVPVGQTSQSPFLHGPYLFPPVGHTNARWGDESRFSAIDRIMTINEAEQVSVRREGRSVVVETILSESTSRTNADGQSGELKQQEFLRAFLDVESSPWPTRVERGKRKFFNGTLLNSPFPEILETTEIVKFQQVGEVLYPAEMVTTRFEYRGDGEGLPKFSHYVSGGTFDIPYEPVLVETLKLSLKKRARSDSELDYGFEFPVGTTYTDRDLNVVRQVR
ncbi:hypothetical protein [Rubinisphaera sp. JC750]|uniref:hypothetical protein n=1 Tax=Rubinisphaera sp. JC750 TaxID=2898658 RepID=UPI001F239371|nr:hypothetical protein [Rubinisphaera sp. JC750]